MRSRLPRVAFVCDSNVGYLCNHTQHQQRSRFSSCHTHEHLLRTYEMRNTDANKHKRVQSECRSEKLANNCNKSEKSDNTVLRNTPQLLHNTTTQLLHIVSGDDTFTYVLVDGAFRRARLAVLAVLILLHRAWWRTVSV